LNLVIERQRLQIEELEATSTIQSGMISIMALAINNMSIEAKLQRILEVVVSIPKLELLLKGAIYIVDRVNGVVVLKAQINLPEKVLETCSKIKFGIGLCGRTAISGKMIFASKQEISRQMLCKDNYTDVTHYSIPMVNDSRMVLGLISLYAGGSHISNSDYQWFYQSLAQTLVRVIENNSK